MAALESYKPVNWRPLTQPDGFRVITLTPGQGNEPLSCSLREVTFDVLEGRYLAISYAWGGKELTHTITCTGYLVRITPNLHSALRRIRQPSTAIYVWCDALCIEQGRDAASLLERSQQISLMSRIFSSAIRVVIDLGDDDGTLVQAFAGINAILATSADLRGRMALHPKPLEYLGLPAFTDPMWVALRKLLSRPWFQRIWCVQEAVLAREIRVILGTYAISLEQLVFVASVYLIIAQKSARVHQTKTWDLLAFNRPFRATEFLIATWQKRTLRKSSAESQVVSLCDLMISTMNQQSTDPRDRIYALYGMTSRQVVRDLPVSYTETVDALSLRASRYLLECGNAVWMLVHSGGIRPGRPSWTLDLTTLGKKERFDPLARTRAGRTPRMLLEVHLCLCSSKIRRPGN